MANQRANGEGSHIEPLPGTVKEEAPERYALWAMKASIIIATVVVSAFALYGVGLAGFYDLPYALSILPFRGRALTEGLIVTLTLIAMVLPVGFILGFAFGWARAAGSRPLRVLSTAYVEFFRGMPPIVLIAFAFLITIVLFKDNPRIDDPFAFAVQISVFALAGHSGAYQAEIIRAGILSVPTGQIEAGEAIGLSRGGILGRIIMPQMFRVSLPALGNEFASVIKDTSLLSAVGALDLVFQGKNLGARLVTTGGNIALVFILWGVIAVVYLIVTSVVTRSLQMIEKRYRVPGLEAAQL